MIDPVAAAVIIADYLIGTAGSLTDALAVHGMPNDYADSKQFLDALDEQVFECDSCGWWCGQEEGNEVDIGLICDDCN